MTADLDPAPDPALALEMRPDQVDASFAGTHLSCAVSRRFDGELLVLDPRSGRIHVLNSSAAVVWDCLDGAASLTEVADELADVFGMPRDVMRSDVVAVARQLGEQSLLDGVSPEPVNPLPTPVALEAGEPVMPFVARTADGKPVRLPNPEARGTLLINWSPFCGYCGAIAEKLGTIREALEAAGVQLVLLTAGTPDDNVAMLRGPGLSDCAAYRIQPGEEAVLASTDTMGRVGSEPAPGAAGFADPFGFMGTPVAYLLDGEGRAVAPLARGAHEVPRLASQAAGLAPEPEEPTSSLPVATGMCGPALGSPNPSRQWAATVGVAVGDQRVGIRVDSEGTEALLREAFGGHVLPAGEPVPANFSVVLGESGRRGSRPAKSLSLLLAGDRTVLRSRSPRRVLEALNTRLSVLAGPVDASLLRTTSVAGVVDGRAILFPYITSRRLELVQSRLARLGVALADGPEALVDPSTAELVVLQPSQWVAAEAMEQLPGLSASPTELPAVAPGRYPIAAWVLDQAAPGGGEAMSIAKAIAGALPAVAMDPEDLDEATEGLSWAVDALAKVFETVRAVVLETDDRKLFAGLIEDVVTEIATDASAR